VTEAKRKSMPYLCFLNNFSRLVTADFTFVQPSHATFKLAVPQSQFIFTFDTFKDNKAETRFIY